MQKFTLLHPDTEINGQLMIDFDKAINHEAFIPTMIEHGLGDIKADKWYPAQIWLDVLTKINASSSLDLVSIGMEQIKNVDWPPEFDTMTIPDVLEAANDVYHEYCRGTDIGEIQVEVLSQKHIKVIVRVFEPDNLWYGNIYQIVRRFGNNQPFTLAYDKETTRRDNGGKHTIMHIRFD